MNVAWDEALPEPFRLREEAVLRADLDPALRRAQGARQADGAEAGDAKAPQHEHRLPEHADGDVEPARLDPTGGDRPQGRHQDQPLRRQGGAGEVASRARLRPGPADRDRRGDQERAERKGQDHLAVHRRQREQARRRGAQGGRSASGARQGRTRASPAPSSTRRSTASFSRWPSPRSARSSPPASNSSC